jgi:hypothetical protein
VRTGKLISALVLAGGFAVVPALAVTPAAHATAGDVVCRGGTINVNIGPGITFQTKTSQITGQVDLGQCTSLSDPSVTGGTATFQATIQGECPDGGNGNGSGSIIWNNGKTSAVQFTFVANQDQVGMSGVHVTSGEFQGDAGSFAGPVTYLPWYQCVFPTGFQNAKAIINEGFLN